MVVMGHKIRRRCVSECLCVCKRVHGDFGSTYVEVVLLLPCAIHEFDPRTFSTLNIVTEQTDNIIREHL